METDDISGSQEGISIDIAGVPTDLGDAAGITGYDTGVQVPTIESWTEVRSDAATARTATAPGTYIKPTSGGGDPGSIFECIVDGDGGTTEPTWGVVDGEVTIDGTTQWIKVNVSRQRGGYQGVVIAAAVQTNGQLMYYLALQADQSIVHGDVDGWTDGIDPDA